MTIKLPETIADKLNTADDAPQVSAFERLYLRSKDILKRGPADFAFMLKQHFGMDEIYNDWAMPYARIDKDGVMYDWRDRVIPADTNRLPIFDTHYTTVDNQKLKKNYFREFVERRTVGKELADQLDLLKMVKAGSEKYPNLSSINTQITVEVREVGTSGEPKFVTKDARLLDSSDLAEYIKATNEQLNTFANAYREAVLLLRQWHEINTRPEFKGQVEIDWNWEDPKTKTSLHRNGAPFKMYAIEMIQPEGFDRPVPQRTTWTAIRWEKLQSFDLDKAAEVISAPDSKVGAYTAILDSKYKKPDADGAHAGQGATEESKRKSRIKVTGDGNMNDVLNESVRFWIDDGTVSSWKNFVYQGLDAAARDDVWYNIVELRDVLDKIVTDAMQEGHQRVVVATRARERAEKEAREKRTRETEQAERQPTAADKWRAQELAKQREAERILSSKPTADNNTTQTAEQEQPAPATQPKPATTGRSRSGTTGRSRTGN